MPTSGYSKGPIKVKSRKAPDFNGYDDYSDRFMMTMVTVSDDELKMMMTMPMILTDVMKL